MKSKPNCDDSIDSQSMTLEARLEIWIVAHCYEQNPRPQRIAELNTIFRQIYSDRRFHRYRNDGNRDYYEDALSLMWRYFFLNLCEVKTARKSGSFLETCNYAVGRLLVNLKGHLKNIEKQRQEEASQQEEPRINSEGDVTEPLDNVPNPKPELASRQFEAFLKLLEEDPTGELKDEINTLRGRKGVYTLTAQTYLLMYYREQKTIYQIAEELNIPRGSVLGGIKPTNWKALARKYAQMAIDLVSE
ncbi:hypothetical protein [Aliterella atlantica]|nr:hypothetical protein [Aliterella atlantica]